VAAMNAGAIDFVEEPFDRDPLLMTSEQRSRQQDSAP
jgi:FixJ family two-component response regulator